MNTIHKNLGRYRELVDDWAAFMDAMHSPLPGCLWVNRTRLDAATLQGLLAEDDIAAQPVDWNPDTFRLPAACPVGNRWWYLAGLAHSQEEVSQLPVRLLAPQPGERVLDLCAAPGGKTAQLALAVGMTGTVVANDTRLDRISALRATIDRLGLLNVSVTRGDGAVFARSGGDFQRVLVDAPCSCEGTWRRTAPSQPEPSRQQMLQRTQVALLRRAVELCRPGGRIVYSTCTFAPEENECVVDQVLRETAGSVQVLPVAPVPGLHTAPGIDYWQGRALAPSLVHTLRLWPHHNDTGGFYIAVLEKDPALPAAQRRPAQLDALTVPELASVMNHFGVPASVYADWRLHQRSSRGVQVVNTLHQSPRRPVPASTGMLVLKTQSNPPKLTTAGALLVTPSARRHVVALEPAQVSVFLARDTFPLRAAQIEGFSRSGFVLVSYRGFGLGTGYLDYPARQVQSLFPKRWAGLSHWNQDGKR